MENETLKAIRQRRSVRSFKPDQITDKELLTVLEAGSVLSAHAQEEIYYKTDHHWTSLGAYLVYAANAPALGLDGEGDSVGFRHGGLLPAHAEVAG